jgi:hypothetical protein
MTPLAMYACSSFTTAKGRKHTIFATSADGILTQQSRVGNAVDYVAGTAHGTIRPTTSSRSDQQGPTSQQPPPVNTRLGQALTHYPHNMGPI